MPAHYSGVSLLDNARVVRLVHFKRNIFASFHRAHLTDFEEFKWIIQWGNTEVWCQKPSPSDPRPLATLGTSHCKPIKVSALKNPRPVSLETPRVWASSALTVPTDDDVFDCNAGHEVDDNFSGACGQCTDEKSEALDATPLVYYLVLSTCQANDPFIHGAHFNGKQIYKLVKCGSRDAAISEAFYACGVNGWSVAFSCIMRADETFEEGEVNVKRVDELWMLGEDHEEEDTVRVFY